MSADADARLREAIAADDVAGARRAISDGADVEPALAWVRSVPMAELLLDAGAALEATDSHGSPLRRAVVDARRGLAGIAELLLRRGAKPDVSLQSAWRGGGAPLMRLLLEAGAKLTPDTRYIVRDDPEAVALLEEWPIRGSTAREPDKQLMLAARAGAVDAVTKLLRDGADVHARDANGATAIDHARKVGHTAVAIVLERAVVAHHPQEALFLAALEGLWVGVHRVAAGAELEARNASGMTPLALAARYRQSSAVEALVAVGAKIDAGALLAAIEAADLRGLQSLLELGGGPAVDVATVRAACAQPDSDLLRLLLVRGFDVTPHPELRGTTDEAERLLRNARAGRLPPASRTATTWKECVLCRDLPASMGWFQSSNGDLTGEPLPEVTEQFETFGWSRRGLWKCPHCGTYYDYFFDHDNAIYVGLDNETLTRTSDVAALASLRGTRPADPRIEREIAALTRWIAFDDAAAAPGRKGLVVDDEQKEGQRWLMIHRLGEDGAKQLAARRVPVGEVEARTAELVARGLVVAYTEEDCAIVWTRDGDRIEVYDERRKLLDAGPEGATLAGGRVVARADVARVIAYASADMSDRGIKAVLRSGEEVDLVYEYSLTAAANAEGWPVYSRNELLCETVWCSTLGHVLAAWANAAFENQV